MPLGQISALPGRNGRHQISMNKIYRQGTLASVWGNRLLQRGELNADMKKKFFFHINKAWSSSWREAKGFRVEAACPFPAWSWELSENPYQRVWDLSNSAGETVAAELHSLRTLLVYFSFKILLANRSSPWCLIAILLLNRLSVLLLWTQPEKQLSLWLSVAWERKVETSTHPRSSFCAEWTLAPCSSLPGGNRLE